MEGNRGPVILRTSIVSGLKTNKLSKPVSTNLTFENKLPKRIKDSYSLIWDDFMDDNVAEALTHAIQEIEQSQRAGIKVRRNHVKRASNDLENYFKAANCLAQESRDSFDKSEYTTKKYDKWDRDAMCLIANMAAFKDFECEEYVTEAIWRRYCPSDQTEDTPGFCPDYRDMYEQIGDEALFADGDIDRAMLWYQLMPIDWENLDDEPDQELSEQQIRIKMRNKWWSDFVKLIEVFLSLSGEDMVHSTIAGIENTLDISGKCATNLHEYLCAWGDFRDGDDKSVPEEIWYKAIEFIKEVTLELDNYDNSEVEKRRLRIEVALAWIMWDQAQYYYLVSKAKGQLNELSDEDINSIKEVFMDGRLVLDKIMPIQKYFEDNYFDEEEFGDVRRLVINIIWLLKAVLSCDQILTILNCGKSSGKVAYYTKHDTLMKMLPETTDFKENVGKFAVMHMAYMNDPNEGKILNNWIFDKTDDLCNGRKRANYPYVFLKCFTTLIDDLPMWEMYGDNAKGYCVVIDLDKTMREEKKSFPVYNVCYISRNVDNSYNIAKEHNHSIDPEEIAKLNKTLEDIIEVKTYQSDNAAYQVVLRQLLTRIAYLFKNADYSHECEKRIIYSTSSGMDKSIKHTKIKKEGEIPMLYVLSNIRVYIDEIIMGPKYSDAAWKVPYLQESLEKMVKEIGLNYQVKLSYSSIEYR